MNLKVETLLNIENTKDMRIDKGKYMKMKRNDQSRGEKHTRVQGRIEVQLVYTKRRNLCRHERQR